jgi:tetratricopeptide (TPR) repeat protein
MDPKDLKRLIDAAMPPQHALDEARRAASFVESLNLGMDKSVTSLAADVAAARAAFLEGSGTNQLGALVEQHRNAIADALSSLKPAGIPAMDLALSESVKKALSPLSSESVSKSLGLNVAIESLGGALAAAQAEISERVQDFTTSLRGSALGHFGDLLEKQRDSMSDVLKAAGVPAMDCALSESARAAFASLAESVKRQTGLLDGLGWASEAALARSPIWEAMEGAQRAPEAPPFVPMMPVPAPLPEPARPPAALLKVLRAQGANQLTLGKLCLMQKLWTEAAFHFKHAARWLKKSPEPYIGLGIALNALGKHKQAVKAFERAERRDAECLTKRPDIRAVYEAAVQGRRWDGQVEDDSTTGN